MGKEIFGKNVNLTLEDTIEPNHCALIIIDMQNDFCSKGGHYDKCGKNLATIKRMIPKLSTLIRNAREQGVLIIYVQNTLLTNGAHLSSSVIAHMLKRWGDESKLLYTLKGTWGHKIIDDIKPQEMDLIVEKNRPSAFTGTNLDLILRSTGKRTIIITGVITEGCVEFTARDGWLRDYYVVIVEDCIASCTPEFHKAQMKIMKHIYHFIIPSREGLKIWKKIKMEVDDAR